MVANFYPTISVVTCPYNSEAFLRQSLHSVEIRTYPHIEHIFNDSPSTDSTLVILEAYIARNRVRYPFGILESPPMGSRDHKSRRSPSGLFHTTCG